jgi:molecular chaperone GrpE
LIRKGENKMAEQSSNPDTSVADEKPVAANDPAAEPQAGASPDFNAQAAQPADSEPPKSEESASPSGSEPRAAANAADLASRLAAAEAKSKEHYDAWLRAKAEMENFRRRSHEDVTKARKFAIESFAEHLLPVVDSLNAALADRSGELSHLREGVDLTLRQLISAFEKSKLLEINPAAGEKFDPHRHQAISTVVSATAPPGHVAAVLQKGWMIADRVLRPALVTVSQSD